MSISDEDRKKMGSDKAKEQFANRREQAKRDEEEVLGGVKKAEQIKASSSDINWALYNFILYTQPFDQTTDWNSANRLLYRAMYPHLERVINENIVLRQLADRYINKMASDHQTLVESILGAETNPQKLAENALNKINELAKARSKLNTYNSKAGKPKLKL